jgi:TonB family protein
VGLLARSCGVVAVLTGVMSVGAAIAAEPPAPAPETVGSPVPMRSWPMAGKWRTDLSRTTYDGPVCATFTVDQNKSFGLRAKDDPNSSLSFVIGGPADEILSANTIKVWIDGFLLGAFPVTRRVQSSTGKAIHAAVPRAQASALLDLFATGQWIAYSTGSKTYSAPLEGSDSALKAFLGCTREVKAANELGATADPDQAERWNWTERCERALSAAARSTGKPNLAGSCSVVWDNRATLPQFSEFDNSIKAIDDALAAVAGTSGLPDLERLGPLLVSEGMIEKLVPTIERLGASPAPTPPMSQASTGEAPPQLMPPTHSAPAVDPSWQSAVVNWLASRKTYPEEARQRGEEGRVAIRFTVDRSGRVLEASIVAGSGSALLDQAAVSLFQGAVLPAFPEAMTQARTTITTTLKYSLR